MYITGGNTNPESYTTNGSVPIKNSVLTEVDGITIELDQLHGIISELETKLAPVLSPSPLERSANEASKHIPSLNLFSKIIDVKTRTIKATHHISEIIRRLEV